MPEFGVVQRTQRSPRRAYRFSGRFVLGWLVTALTGATRSLAHDAARLLQRYPEPQVEGREHIPRDTPFILVANHYERDGLRIWWTALALTHVLDRPTAGPLRWLSIDRLVSYRLVGFVPVPPPLTAAVIRFVAARYALLLVSRERVQLRAPLLREARRALYQQGHSIALFPEGIRAFSNQGLVEAFDGSGQVLAWLSDGRVPILPAAVHDDESGTIRVRFGETLLLDRRGAHDPELTTAVMSRIAAMLPEALRGAYAAPESMRGELP